MKIICIARWNDETGKKLAETLAEKLGYSCYSREALTEEATEAGIPVGKLETAVLKPGLFTERLKLERDRYKAFATARLCEKALEGDLVYHGRTGHLLLPGVSHVLRIRVEENVERRIASAMTRLKLPRDKARAFVESVDDDIRKWVKTQYGQDWQSSAHYDIVVNLEQMGVANAATALCAVATLPEFQDTPASRQALRDLLLASRVRWALGKDERTRAASLHVIGNRGDIVVTYQPQDMGVAEAIPEVAATVEGVCQVDATMATSNLLWVQEHFDPEGEVCQRIVDLARGWNVAVDLLRVRPGDDGEGPSLEPPLPASKDCADAPREPDGGIEDDDGKDSEEDEDDAGLAATHRRLLREGVAGGTRVACGLSNRISECVDQHVDYLLVVLGELFLDKGQATRTRLTRELSSSLHDRLKSPVIGIDELKKSYSFGPTTLLKLAAYLAAVALIFFLVFTHQAEVLRFVSASTTQGKVLAALSVFVVTPVVAYLYGSFTKGIFKLIRLD